MGAGQTPGEGIGNGRATALLLASEGARVVAADRELDRARATADEITSGGGQAVALRADVTDPSQVEATVRAALETFGRIDVLHNNVGVSLAAGDAPIDDIDAEIFDRVTRINLTGMVMTCNLVLPVMRAQGRGVIINISSTA